MADETTTRDVIDRYSDNPELLAILLDEGIDATKARRIMRKYNIIDNNSVGGQIKVSLRKRIVIVVTSLIAISGSAALLYFQKIVDGLK